MSTLGVKFLALYCLFLKVNDMPLHTSKCQVDDYTMHTSGKTTVNLESRLLGDLEHVNNCLDNKICHNNKKIKCILVTTRQ